MMICGADCPLCKLGIDREFKKGDIVKFKSPTSSNAGFFGGHLTGLTIVCKAENHDERYIVRAHDGDTWYVKEDELVMDYDSV